jgi:hypothetical protein
MAHVHWPMHMHHHVLGLVEVHHLTWHFPLAGRGSNITGQKATGQGAKVPFARQREALAESLYRQ